MLIDYKNVNANATKNENSAKSSQQSKSTACVSDARCLSSEHVHEIDDEAKNDGHLHSLAED